MELQERQVWNMQLNLGELVELLLEFPELEVLVLPEVDKEPSVTCAEKEECSLH